MRISARNETHGGIYVPKGGSEQKWVGAGVLCEWERSDGEKDFAREGAQWFTEGREGRRPENQHITQNTHIGWTPVKCEVRQVWDKIFQPLEETDTHQPESSGGNSDVKCPPSK